MMQPTGLEELQQELGLLFAHLGRALKADPGPLGMGNHFVLTWLMRAGACRAQELAVMACLDASTLSRRLAHMEQRGYIERVPDPADRRAQLVRVTELGEAAYAAERVRRAELVTDRLAGWDAADVTALATLLARLNSTFDSAEEPLA